MGANPAGATGVPVSRGDLAWEHASKGLPMQHARLGGSGLTVSRIALGCMSFGDPASGFADWTFPQDEALPYFQQALELGITFWDTANVYSFGDSERITGEALRRLVPDVAVLDVRMPVLDGLGAAEAILATGSPTKILLLTTYDDDTYLYRALQAGASGFLLKSMPTEELLGAIRVAARGDALIDPSVTQRLAVRLTAGLAPHPEPPELHRLTAREREILLELAHGRSNAEIAAALYLGEQTVKTHVSRVLTKLGLRDRVQAVVYVYEHGLLSTGLQPRQNPTVG